MITRIASRSLRYARLLGASLLARLLALSAPPVAYAATITFTTTGDELNRDGECSLCEALPQNQDQREHEQIAAERMSQQDGRPGPAAHKGWVNFDQDAAARADR